MNTPSGVSTHIRTRRTWFISNSQAADCPGMDTTDMICSATCTKRKCTVAAPISRQVNTIKYNGKHVYTQRLRLSGRKQFSPSSLESVSGSRLRVKLLPQALAHRVAVCYEKRYAHSRYSPSWSLWEAFSCIAAFPIFPCEVPTQLQPVLYRNVHLPRCSPRHSPTAMAFPHPY